MDPKHSGNVLKHLRKQRELLMDVYRSMSHDMRRLKIEEDMLMHKYFELMAAHGLINKKADSDGVKENEETNQERALVIANCERSLVPFEETNQERAIVLANCEKSLVPMEETNQERALVLANCEKSLVPFEETNQERALVIPSCEKSPVSIDERPTQD